MAEDSEERMRTVLKEAASLVGDGPVQLEVWSMPVTEHVYVTLEEDQVVVNDGGRTFVEILRSHDRNDDFVEWSPELATVPAQTLGVSIRDETERDEPGEVIAMGWRLTRLVQPGESVADSVQAMAHAIDGVLAVHLKPGAPIRDGFFWEQRDDGVDD